MKQYLDRVVAELPQFISTFVHCLSQPRRFLAAQLESLAAGQATSESLVEKGVAFLVTSFLMAFLLSLALPEVTDPLSLPSDDAAVVRLGSETLRALFLFMAGFAIAYGVLRRFGAQTTFSAAFGLACYFCGVTLVLWVAASATSNIAMADPFTAQAWISLEKSAETLTPDLVQLMSLLDPRTGELPAGVALPAGTGPEAVAKLLELQGLMAESATRPLSLVAAGVQAAVTSAIFLWLLVAWFAFGAQQGISRFRVALASLLAGLGLGTGLLLYVLITAGATVMSLYRSGSLG
jgi:hypothetical protein